MHQMNDCTSQMKEKVRLVLFWMSNNPCHYVWGGITVNQTEEKTNKFLFAGLLKKKAEVMDLKLLWITQMEAKFGTSEIEAVGLTK